MYFFVFSTVFEKNYIYLRSLYPRQAIIKVRQSNQTQDGGRFRYESIGVGHYINIKAS